MAANIEIRDSNLQFWLTLLCIRVYSVLFEYTSVVVGWSFYRDPRMENHQEIIKVLDCGFQAEQDGIDGFEIQQKKFTDQWLLRL